MNKVKHASSALKAEVESRVRVLEQQYITDPSDPTKEAWQAGQSAYEHLLSSAEKKRLFSKQVFFKGGGKTSRLLARFVNSHQRSPAIGTIKSWAGPLVSPPELIMQELAGFYESLYYPGTTYAQDNFDLYLQNISFPELMEGQRQGLEAPLNIEEIQEAVGSFPNCKVPGEDGIPTEIYKQYSEVLLPLKVCNRSLECRVLPPSISKTNIVILLKPGKESVDLGS